MWREGVFCPCQAPGFVPSPAGGSFVFCLSFFFVLSFVWPATLFIRPSSRMSLGHPCACR